MEQLINHISDDDIDLNMSTNYTSDPFERISHMLELLPQFSLAYSNLRHMHYLQMS